MIEMLTQFDQLLACVLGVFVGACGCWIVQCWLQQRPRSGRRSYAYSETPAISAAAQAKVSCWDEAEKLLSEMQDILEMTGVKQPPVKGAANLGQAQQTIKQLKTWFARQKRVATSSGEHDTAAVLKQRAVEDELVMQWLNEKPGTTPAQHGETPPELALTQIASELLPFNPIAVRLIGKTADADMSAAVERIEKLLASVDPPETLGTLPQGTMPAALEPALAIRDPQARNNLQADDPQRRRSDQAIIYDTLRRRCLGDDDFAWRMLHKFPTRCRTELESLATEIRRRAWTAATRRITQLRGMAANLAAENLRDALANLENVCRQQSATRADQLLCGVYGEFQQVLDFLARAGGEQPCEQSRNEENRPLSRWPAALLTAEDYAPLHLEPHSAGSVT